MNHELAAPGTGGRAEQPPRPARRGPSYTVFWIDGAETMHRTSLGDVAISIDSGWLVATDPGDGQAVMAWPAHAVVHVAREDAAAGGGESAGG